MPQLDRLTYFSQFVYLFISFVATYVFVLSFIIPKLVSVRKLRHKLFSSSSSNSVALVTSSLDPSGPTPTYGDGASLSTDNPLVGEPLLGIRQDGRDTLPLALHTYDQLTHCNWRAYTKLSERERTLTSANIAQIAEAARAQKLSWITSVQPYR